MKPLDAQINRRQALALLAGLGATAFLGGSGCFRPVPTRPTSIWAPGTDEAFALTNSTIIDVAGARAIEGRSVLVQGGLIRGVFEDGAPELAHARPVDCRGAFMIPGLINAHCHITSPSILNAGLGDTGTVRDQIIQNYVDSVCWGVTTVRDMGSLPKIISRDREAIDHGNLLGPRILTAVSVITVPNGYPDFIGDVNWLVKAIVGKPNIRARDAGEAADAVTAVRDQGADLVKIAFDDRSFVYGRGMLEVLSDAQVEAIKNQADRYGMRIGAHHLYSSGLDRALAFGIDTVEHVAMDAELTDAQIQKVLDTRTPIVPTITVGVSMAFRTKGDPMNDDPVIDEVMRWKQEVQLKELPEHSTDEIRERSLEIKRFYENSEYELKKNRNLVSFDPKIATRGLVTASGNLRRLIAAGAVLGAGNDSGVPFDFPGMLHLEIEWLGRMGMSNADSLAAATIVNAEICGLREHCGSIEKGKWADLVLLKADPLQDLKNVGKVAAVFKNGALVSKADDFPIAPSGIG